MEILDVTFQLGQNSPQNSGFIQDEASFAQQQTLLDEISAKGWKKKVH